MTFWQKASEVFAFLIAVSVLIGIVVAGAWFIYKILNFFGVC